MIEAGYPINRLDDYEDWFNRFETALRALPEDQRQQSSLPLLHQMFGHPMPVQTGGTAPALNFHADVRKFHVGEHKDVPHLSAEFIWKYLDDLKQVGLIKSKTEAA